MVNLPPLDLSTEVAPFYHGYLQALDSHDPLQVLQSDLDTIEIQMKPFLEKPEFRYAPDKWSVREVYTHILQVEQIFGYRLLRLSMLDATPMAGFDENNYIENATNTLSLPEMMFHFKNLRYLHVQAVLNLKESHWLFAGNANGNQITTRAQALVMSGHYRHHLRILNERYV